MFICINYNPVGITAAILDIFSAHTYSYLLLIHIVYFNLIFVYSFLFCYIIRLIMIIVVPNIMEKTDGFPLSLGISLCRYSAHYTVVSSRLAHIILFFICQRIVK